MSMDGILGVLVEKARVEAEDAQRILLAALNGLAGIFLLEGRPADGIALYRQVCGSPRRRQGRARVGWTSMMSLKQTGYCTCVQGFLKTLVVPIVWRLL